MSTEGKYENSAYVNKSNSIKRIRADYNEPWIGVLRETIQNSTDAWGFNRDEGALEEDADLKIEFVVDSEENTLTIRDNAGGMNRQTLENNLFALDNPSAPKTEGNSLGAYGRGFWVIMSTGDEAHVETKHQSGVFKARVDTAGTYTDVSSPDYSTLAGFGTTYKIQNVKEEDMLHFSEWTDVEDALVENFAPLLSDDRVTIEFTIDGDVHTPEGPKLEEIKQDQLLHEEEIVESFSYYGSEYNVTDFVMASTKGMNDPPWEKVVMFKGNEYLDYPFMKVDEYRPIGIPSMRNPVKMFGWCNVNSVCPEWENNAHDSIQISKFGERSNLKKIIEQVHRENFQNRFTTNEKADLADDIREQANSILGTDNTFSRFATEGDENDVDRNITDKPPTDNQVSFLVCSTEGYKFDLGDDVPLWVDINFSEEPEFDTYEVYGAHVKQKSGKIVEEFDNITVDAVENSPVKVEFPTFSSDTDSKFEFHAKVRGVSTDGTELPREDNSQTTFTVGEVDENESESDTKTNAEFVTSVKFFSNRDAPRKAFAREKSDGGLEVMVNIEWPTITQLEKRYTGKQFEQRQKETLVEWTLEAVSVFRLLKKFEELEFDEAQELFEEHVELTDKLERLYVENE